jgi:SAM-dependent methyltransferase
MDFNTYKNTYTQTIEKSLRFSGKEHDFFTQVKASSLQNIIGQFLPNIKNISLLDIGCGHGFIHKHLKNKDLHITGVEIADEVLKLAHQLNPEVSYFPYDGNILPFSSQQFDVAITICVMHHVNPLQWQNFLSEMKRVVKKEGIVVIFEHNPYNPVTRHIVAKNILDNDAVLLSSFKLKNMMRRSGLNHVHSRNILFTPFANKFFRWLDRKLGRFPFGAQYYAVGFNK